MAASDGRIFEAMAIADLAIATAAAAVALIVLDAKGELTGRCRTFGQPKARPVEAGSASRLCSVVVEMIV